MTTILNSLTLPLESRQRIINVWKWTLETMHTLIKENLICCYATPQAHVVDNDNAHFPEHVQRALPAPLLSNKYASLNL